MMEEKKKVIEYGGSFHRGDLDMETQESAIAIIKSAFAGAPDDAILDEDDGHFRVWWLRDETDEEFEMRTRQEKNRQGVLGVAERRQLVELMEKYPDVVKAYTQKQS